MRLWRILALAVVAGFPVDGRPCSVTHIATPDELVTQADAIVRARVVGDAARASSTTYGPVVFQVLERLKGAAPSDTFSVLGYTNKYEGANHRKPPYRSVRPGGQHGNCFAHDYKRDKEFLLFLREGTPYWAALAPVNEEVGGVTDPWVVWVKGALRGAP